MVLRHACGGKYFCKGTAWAIGGSENAFAHVHSQNDRFYQDFEHAMMSDLGIWTSRGGLPWPHASPA